MTYAVKVWYLKNYFQGEPKLSDFVVKQESLSDSDLQENDLICEAEYWSVDPYMRKYMDQYPEGTAMIGTQVAKVLASKNPLYPVGSYIYGHFGWRTHTLVKDPSDSKYHPIKPYPCPDVGKNNPRSYALGCLGRPGNSAYFGFLDLCKPKAGETVVVSGAAGAVGCLVGQIAKIKGCKVIGIAGSDEKCKWLTDSLGFDIALNYKDANFIQKLNDTLATGVDCYFDNVGGEISYHVLNNMNEFGRTAICGAISSYNLDPKNLPKVPPLLYHRKQLRIEGFLVRRWYDDRWFEGINQIREWLDNKQIVYNETVTHGFSNIPQAFIEMMKGKNFGKAIIKALTIIK